MRLSRKDIIETTLFDSEKILTVTYLSRHADISVHEARDELEGFYTANKERANLYAVYLISGEMQKVGEMSQTGNSDGKFCRFQLVKEGELEDVKRGYSVVDSCEIFCLYTRPNMTLFELYNVDHMEDNEFVGTDPERSWIHCPLAQIKRAEMLEQHAESAKNLEKMAKVKSTQSQGGRHHETLNEKGSGQLPEGFINQKKKEVSSVNSFFSKAAASRKRSFSPEKEIDRKACKSPAGDNKQEFYEGETSRHPHSQKRRSQRIFIDGEEDGEREKETAKMSAKKKSVNGKESLTQKNATSLHDAKADEIDKADQKELTKTRLSQEDLFSDGASSPEPERMPMDDPEEGYKEKQSASFVSAAKKKCRSPPRSVMADSKAKPKLAETESADDNKPPTRKEHVTETYLDEDGFMVTKQVLKDVIVNSPAERSENHTDGQKPSEFKEKQRPSIPSIIGMKKPRQQRKIESFFAKK